MAKYATARMRFLVDTGVMPVSASVGPTGRIEHRGEYEVRSVELEDVRGEATSLDREGFVRVDQPTAVADFYDPSAVAAVYYEEVRALVRAATGARRVEVFDHTLRSADVREQAERVLREPLDVAHNDYTVGSGPERLRLALPDEAGALLARRFAIVQVWRPTHEPVAARPLALCDARSVDAAHLRRAERRHKDRVGYIYHLLADPAQRWCWFPNLRRDEAIVFKVFDSDPRRARFTPHASPTLDQTPADAPPRRSIEVRTLAFF